MTVFPVYIYGKKSWPSANLCCFCRIQKPFMFEPPLFHKVWCVAEIRAEISHVVQSEYHKSSVIPNDDHTCHWHHLELRRSALRFDARFRSSLPACISLCPQPVPYWLCVLLINHLSAESSRSCVTAFSDDGDAAYFAWKISSRRMLIEWQWSRYGVAMKLLGYY